MGRRHAEDLLRVAGARLVAVADANAALAARVASDLRTAAVTVDELLARDDVRAVVIASPRAAHETHAVAAARSGKDVLVEKPIAPTLEAADRIIAAAREAGVRLQVGFQRRYDPSTMEAYRLLRSGAVGKPLLFRAIARDRDAPVGPPGTLDPVDILIESAIHDLDLARWLMADEVLTVRATLATLGPTDRTPGPDLALVELRLAGGAMAHIETFRGARYAYDIREEVVCEAGTLVVGGHAQGPLTVLRPGDARADLFPGFLERFADAYFAEMSDFVRGALERRRPGVTGDDGRRALAIGLAAMRAAVEGREVAITPSAT